MRKYLFMSMLGMAIGGHFLASADVANPQKRKTPNAAQKAANARPAVGKPITQKPATKEPVRAAKFQKPKTQVTHFHHKDSSSSSSSSSRDSDGCKKDCCQYVISSKDINKGKGVIIDKPGVWCLDGNACFNPKPSRYSPPDPRAVQAAITVKAGVSNVIIDLCNYRLSQAKNGSSSQTPYVVGILVPDPDPTNPDPEFVGAESIYIKGNDAIIDGFSMYGVRIFAHTSDIEISDLTIKNTAHLASKALRPTVYGVPYLPHGQLTPAFGPSFGVAGLAIGESIGYGSGPVFFNDVPTNQLNVVNRTQNIRLNNVNCLNNFSIGASIIRSTNVTIDDCHFDYTWSDDPGSGAGQVYPAIAACGLGFGDGLEVLASPNGNSEPNNVNVTMSHSSCNNTSAKGDYTKQLVGLKSSSSAIIAYGCADSNSKNVVFSNCQFNSSSCTYPCAVLERFDDFSFVPGFVGGYFSVGAEDLTFTDCTFDGHFNLSNVSGAAIGGSYFNALAKSPRNIRFYRCSANNLQCRTDLILPAPPLNNRTVQGWNIIALKDVYFEDCISEDIYVSGPTSSTGSTNSGFGIGSLTGNPATQVENWTFKNCTAARVRAVDGGVAWGFNTFVPYGNSAKSFVYEGCISTGNQTALSSIYAAWSDVTSYSIGALVSFSDKNYVSLVNSNLNNTPDTSPVEWNVVNTNPAAWVNTTSYSQGDLVSFTDATGHTNEYISTINGNLGNFPNAPAPISATSTNWMQTNWYPTWNSTATYQNGSIVGYEGVNYRSLVAGNINFQPDTNPAQWSTATNVVQATAGGFFSQENQNGPAIYKNCIASQNIGAPGPVFQAGLPRYSTGFGTILAFATLYESCVANQNIYGFMLQNCTKCIVKGCESYSNSLNGVGEGFTDVGNNIGAVITVNVNNAGTGYLVGDILTLAAGSGTATVEVTGTGVGGAVSTVTVVNPGTTYTQGTVATTGGSGTGARITITSVLLVTPASPTVSTSMFEGNTAYNNGAGTAHVGPNGNYNIWVDAGTSIRPLLLECVNATSACVIDPTNDDTSLYFAGKHNLSTTNN